MTANEMCRIVGAGMRFRTGLEAFLRHFLGRLSPMLWAVAIMLPGCSTIDLNAARTLASAGVEASSAAAAEAATARTNFQGAREFGVVLRAVADRRASNVSGVLANPGFQGVEQRAERVAALLLQRQKAIQQLATTYRAFAALASYDAVGEFTSAYDGLVKEANGFITAVNAVTAGTPLPLLTTGVTAVGRTVLGIVADERHKANVEQASVLLREALEKLVAALRAEQQYASSLRRVFIEQQGAVRTALMREGVLTYQGEVEALARQLGGAPVSNIDRVVARKPNVRNALDARAQYRTQRAGERAVADYEAMLGTFDVLREQHLSLERGRPLDLPLLQEWIARLDSLASVQQ